MFSGSDFFDFHGGDCMKKLTMMGAAMGALFAVGATGVAGDANAEPLFTFTRGEAESPEVEIFSGRVGDVIPAHLFGKFCEHLGRNIYHGMDAQILHNPTFATCHFGGTANVDGGVYPSVDSGQLERQLTNSRNPDTEGIDPEWILSSWGEAIAVGWLRLGKPDAVRFSPDTAFAGNRAQRVETHGATAEAPAGLTQRCWLPLHRTRGYQWRISLRAPQAARLRLEIAAEPDGPAAASAVIAPGDEWTTFTGAFDLPADWPTDNPVWVRLVSDRPAHWVVRELALMPDDAVDGQFDPDIVRMLRESRLPLLRWPGGNFVSGYRWRDGVGPVDRRPTIRNPAWGGIENHRFGTAEFIRYCRAIGAEPMICLNAGNGSAEEAAAWVEYCNGGLDTEGGRLRASHGDPEPYNIRIWEIGNELEGRH